MSDSTSPTVDHHEFFSVVVIARNEQATITDCLESARGALGARAHELLLVDSASTDQTVETALRVKGVEVLQLPMHPLLGPSLGRFAGFKRARGELILFLDGDMVLLPGWLDLALAALRQDPRLAGIAGDMEHEMPDGQIVSHGYPASEYDDAGYLGGSALYRREALQSVGSFNPLMRSSEEEELGARLRKQGYRLARLHTAMVRHHPKFASQTFGEMIRRRSRGFYFGCGQLVRHAMQFDLPVKNPWGPVWRFFVFDFLLALGFFALIVGLLQLGWWPLVTWLVLLAGIFTLFAIKAKGVKRPFYYFAEWAFAGPSVILGFLTKPRKVETYASAWRDLSRSIVVHTTAGRFQYDGEV